MQGVCVIFILFILAKILAYCLVFYVAKRGFNICEADSTTFPIDWSLIKLAIGMPFGVAIIFIYTSLENAVIESK